MPALLATPPRPLSELRLPPPRLAVEDRTALAAIVGATQLRDSPEERAFHARGRSYRDLLLLRFGDLSSPPDAVIYPRDTGEVLAVLALAAERGLSVRPFGGGTAFPAPPHEEGDCVVVLDLSDMDRVIAVDPFSNTADVEAGIYGPALDTALKTRGLRLGHAPAEFEFSTLGGWIAEAAAPLCGGPHKWLLAVKLATPSGLIEVSGAELGSLAIGAEGRFGVITEATIRLKPAALSHHRTYLFSDFASGLAAIRTAEQEGCDGTALHLFDSETARFTRAFESIGRKPGIAERLLARYAAWRGFSGKACLLVAAMEGDAASLAFQRARFGAIARRYGALDLGKSDSFRQTRFMEPYIRDSLIDRGVGMARFEARVRWSKVAAVYEAGRGALEDVLRQNAPREGAHGLVLGGLGHAASEGASIALTAIFPRAIGADLEQEEKIAAAVEGALLTAGGHLHRNAPRRKREPAVAVFRAIQETLDPKGVIAAADAEP